MIQWVKCKIGFHVWSGKHAPRREGTYIVYRIECFACGKENFKAYPSAFSDEV